MSPKERSLSKESTVYTYRLLQRIHYQPYYVYIYSAIGAGPFFYALFLFKPMPALGAFLGIPLVQLLFLLFLLHTKERRAAKSWHWTGQWPWIGYAPGGYVALHRARRLHRQIFWVGLLLLGCLYPWLPLPWFCYLIFLHFYTLFPRLFLLWRLRKHKEQGYLKLGENDTSCYAQ